MDDGSIVVFLDDDGVLDLIVEFDDLALVCRLLVARRIVFGVLGEVAVAARLTVVRYFSRSSAFFFASLVM